MSTFERPRKEVLSTKRSRASCAASRCKPLHQGKHRDQLQWTTTCRAQDIHCMRAPVPFHESKRVSRSRHRYHMVCEYVMRRRTSEHSQASFHHQVRTARARSASPRPSTNFAGHALRRLQASDAEGPSCSLDFARTMPPVGCRHVFLLPTCLQCA